MSDRCKQADEATPGMPHEMCGRGVETLHQSDEVIDVREHRVVRAFWDCIIGPRIPSTVRNRSIGRADRWKLLSPSAQVGCALMDEDNGLALAFLAIRELDAIDGNGSHSLECRVIHGLGPSDSLMVTRPLPQP